MTGVVPESVAKRRLGALGHLGCLAFVLGAAVGSGGWRVAVVCSLSLALAVGFYPTGLRPWRSLRLWAFVAILVLSAALLGEGDGWSLGGVLVSRRGLEAGVQMALRAVAIVTAVAGFAGSLSLSELAGLLERVGLKGLGFAFGVAVNMLPAIQDTAAVSYQALRLRGGFRRQRLRALRLLLVTVVVNSLRRAEDTVLAAEIGRASCRERV